MEIYHQSVSTTILLYRSSKTTNVPICNDVDNAIKATERPLLKDKSLPPLAPVTAETRQIDEPTVNKEEVSKSL